MGKAVGRVFVFLLVVLATFIWIGYAITEMTGGEKKAASAVEVTPEGGAAIFWGKGRCYTCHSLGDEGSAVRCPNLGQFGEKFAMPIGERAVQRAKERSEKSGQHFSATDYLVESLANPGAYVVDGYKDEMAIVFAPPISLNLDEIKAVVSYLQSQGGDVDTDALNKPSKVSTKFFARVKAASAAGGGDPGHGEEVFLDNCSECHTIKGEGSTLGPDLSSIGKIGVKKLKESIFKPAKVIVKGYETTIIIDNAGRKVIGIKTREADGEVDITTKEGDVETFAVADIKKMEVDSSVSIMPDDLSDAMTVKDYQDLQSFLIMQKGK